MLYPSPMTQGSETALSGNQRSGNFHQSNHQGVQQFELFRQVLPINKTFGLINWITAKNEQTLYRTVIYFTFKKRIESADAPTSM